MDAQPDLRLVPFMGSFRVSSSRDGASLAVDRDPAHTANERCGSGPRCEAPLEDGILLIASPEGLERTVRRQGRP